MFCSDPPYLPVNKKYAFKKFDLHCEAARLPVFASANALLQFAMVALLRCRLQRFLAHWASASLSRTAGNSAPPCSNAAGEALTTACGGNIVRAEVNRNKRSPLCGVAPIEVAESKLCLAIAVTRSYLADGCSMGLVTHSFVVDKSSSPGGSPIAKNRRFQGSRLANTGPAAG